MKQVLALLFFLAMPGMAQIVLTATIPNGQAVSAAIETGVPPTRAHTGLPAAVLMPAAWTAADLLVEASVDGTTWFPVFDFLGIRMRIIVDSARVVVLDASMLWALPRIRVRSVAVGGTTDVNQGADRVLTFFIVR